MNMVIDLEHLPKPDVLLVLNGVIDWEILNVYLPCQCPMICTDGASAQLYSNDIIPNVVIGDMDSIPPHILPSLSQLTTIITIDDQDSTDFEKALQHCKSLGLKKMLVFGFHGGDFDHSFNNVSVVAKFANDFEFVIVDNGRICFHIDSKTVFHNVRIGEIVSLITYNAVNVTTSGLHWALNKEFLRFGVREGARNKANANEVVLDIHEGAMIACFDFKH
jgi:thiamine pyrophosphokinase